MEKYLKKLNDFGELFQFRPGIEKTWGYSESLSKVPVNGRWVNKDLAIFVKACVKKEQDRIIKIIKAKRIPIEEYRKTNAAMCETQNATVEEILIAIKK